MEFKLTHDRYSNARPGQSRFYNLYCARCRHHVCLYQKDGTGMLVRLYKKRIMAPTNLLKPNAKEIRCPHCKVFLAAHYIYDKEQRSAYLVQAGAIVRRVTTGIFPPATAILE